jgi:hypothetical protein
VNRDFAIPQMVETLGAGGQGMALVDGDDATVLRNPVPLPHR